MTSVAPDVVSCEHEPGPARSRIVEQRPDLREVLAIHLDAERLREVDEGGIVGRFVQPAAAGQKEFGHDGHVALGVLAAPDEGLPARIGERPRCHAEQRRNAAVCLDEFLAHPRDREILEGFLTRERKVSAARMRQRMVANLVAGGDGALPFVELGFDRRWHHEQRDLDAVAREHRQPLRHLALPPIVEAQAEGHSRAARPGRRRRLRTRGRAQSPDNGRGQDE